MDNSKVLCIGFTHRVLFFDITEEPLDPKLITSLDTIGTSVHVKLDENLIILYGDY